MALPVLPAIEAPELPARHAFFTRQGGVSLGDYASLNGGLGSRDDPAHVAENHRRMCRHLGVETLIVPYQTHSSLCATIDRAWIDTCAADPARRRPPADALATSLPDVALGVTGADCGMILLADRSGEVIGAVHAGWKGALNGVLEATVEAMEQLGAERAGIVAVLGPSIAQRSYEVGADFRARFDAVPGSDAFFQPSERASHAMFDLHGFIGWRLRAAGIGRFIDLGLDTYSDEERFFSYRRMTHRSETDYGRLISAIARRT